MPPRRTLWRFAGFFVLALSILLTARVLMLRSFDDGPMPPPLAAVGRIPVTMPDGSVAPIGSLLRPGLPTVVTLWASWCGPCRSEAPKIAELRRRFGPETLNLLYLNAREDGASHDDLEKYLTSVGFAPDAYAVLSQSNLSRLTNDSQNLIPRTYLFDRAGVPQAMIVGYNPLALDRIAGLIEK